MGAKMKKIKTNSGEEKTVHEGPISTPIGEIDMGDHIISKQSPKSGRKIVLGIEYYKGEPRAIWMNSLGYDSDAVYCLVDDLNEREYEIIVKKTRAGKEFLGGQNDN